MDKSYLQHATLKWTQTGQRKRGRPRLKNFEAGSKYLTWTELVRSGQFWLEEMFVYVLWFSGNE